MKYKMNKKGAGSNPIYLVLAVFIGILLLIFLLGGGISAAWDITKFLKSIPTPVWIFLGIIFLFSLLRGGKRK